MKKFFFKICFIVLFVSACGNVAFSQTNSCTTLGQNPQTAFPVCGTTYFSQTQVPQCGGRPVVCPSCPNAPFSDKNPFWYKFTCYATGTLGFLIKPNVVNGDDYDWQIFDVTGLANLDDIYDDPSYIVACNWSAEYLETGTSDILGTQLTECEGPGVNTFSTMPVLIKDHHYLLLVSHFLNTDNGYQLSFGGGTAVITDPLIPAINSATSSCDNLHVTLKMNKNLKCNTLAADGTDFSIDYTGTSIIAAKSVACSFNFDTDSLILTLSNPLPAGTYKIKAKVGTDLTTMLDYCDNAIPVGDSISFTIVAPALADFNATGPFCANNNILFTDNSSPVASITNWHWDMGDGNVYDLPNNNPFTHAYNVAGPYTVSLTCTNAAGCISATINKPITIIDLPSAAATGNSTVCQNSGDQFVRFTGSGGTAPYLFQYTINGVAQTPVLSNNAGVYTFTISSATPGTFIYEITNVAEGSLNACSKNLSNVKATVNITALPTASISGSTEVCAGDGPITITLTGSGGTAPYKFQYRVTTDGVPGPVQTTTGNPATVILPNAGMWLPLPLPFGPIPAKHVYTYSLVSVQESSPQLCTQPQTGDATVVINQVPWTNAGVLPRCQLSTVNFIDILTYAQQTVNLVSWTWDFGDPTSPNNTSTLQNPSHVYANAGTYIVKHTSTSDKGCTGSVSGTVIIKPHPFADFIEPKVCLDDVFAQFTDKSTIASGSTIVNWQWDFGDGNTGSGPNPTHIYTAVGSYNVRLLVTSNDGCSDEITKPIFVNGSNPVPGFAILNPGTVCANELVSLENHATVTPGNVTRIKINWDDVGTPGIFDTDNNPTPGKIYTHIYPDFQSPPTKNFTIRYRAYSGSGEVCTTDSLKTITVTATPKVLFNAIPDTCLLVSPFQLTQASELNGLPGVYSGGTYITAGGIFSPALAGVGSHTITYTCTSIAGCTDSKTRTINVLDTSSARFAYSPAPHCDGEPVIFTDQSTQPVVLDSTIWDFGDGSPVEHHAAGTSFPHIFRTWGVFTVKMYNISKYGCNSTFTTQQVKITPLPKTYFDFGETSVCLPNAKISFINRSTIDDHTENAFRFSWDFGDPASGALNHSTATNPPPHVYTNVGPYTVRLSVTSGDGCIRVYPKLIDFIHQQPKAAFNPNKPSTCFEEEVIFTDATDPIDGTTQSWHWSLGDGTSIPSYPIINYKYLNTGTYDVSLYIINSVGCHSDTLHKPYTVYPYPDVYAGPDRRVLEGAWVKMQPVVSGNDLSYLWTPNLYLNNTTILLPTAQYVKDDITYKLTVTGRGNCPKSDDIYIKVLKRPLIPNTFTPNGDGINDKWDIKYLKDYPNCRVQIFTRTGQGVFEHVGVYEAWDGKKNGKLLPFDTYYYIIEAGDGLDAITGYVTIVR